MRQLSLTGMTMADLWGACAGAFLTAAFLVPIWGLPGVMMLLLILNGIVLLRLIKTESVS